MSLPRRKVIVVDDAGPVVVLCVNVLQALGYSVKGANRGEAALELLRRESFDLMIVDYKMPGLNGFQVLTAARELRPDLRSVLITGHGTPEIMRDADKLRFDGVLPKPFTSSELRDVIERVFAGKE
jgi:two-component system response regulator (stage 0 sporulation protein F)